jgi:NADP-dependent 3-hydroxy acid dehydrogenase YdfG
MSWIDLSGEVAVVTGAAAGIGRGIALGLPDVGATLVLLARTHPVRSTRSHRAAGAVSL